MTLENQMWQNPVWKWTENKVRIINIIYPRTNEINHKDTWAIIQQRYTHLKGIKNWGTFFFFSHLQVSEDNSIIFTDTQLLVSLCHTLILTHSGTHTLWTYTPEVYRVNSPFLNLHGNAAYFAKYREVLPKELFTNACPLYEYRIATLGLLIRR